MKEEIKKLEEERAQIEAQIADLEAKLSGLRGVADGLERAMTIVAGKELLPNRDVPTRRERARGVKEAVLGAVQNAGPKGLTVGQLMDRTQREGIHLERGTVSSLLSRFKREGILDMEDGRYFDRAIAAREAQLVKDMMN